MEWLEINFARGRNKVKLMDFTANLDYKNPNDKLLSTKSYLKSRFFLNVANYSTALLATTIDFINLF